MTSVKAIQITELGGPGMPDSAGGAAFDHSVLTTTGGARPLSGACPVHEGVVARPTVGTMLPTSKTG